MLSLPQKIFGSVNERRLKPLHRRVQKINALEPAMQALSDEDLRAKTDAFKQALADGASLDDILNETFAVVRESAKRSLGLRHFDVQLLGGIILHNGAIAEMRTGEGKTLVATLPAYLNALTGKGVHVVTVNDYLAGRDAAWMGKLYDFLGMTTGVITPGLNDEERRAAYNADITYGTNNEYGFDYLRDNMKYTLADMVQRGHPYAIVDEVDSILIDEARTPLIISGPTDDRSQLYRGLDALIPRLDETDFDLDEKMNSVVFTEDGLEKMEDMLTREGLLEGSLWEPTNVTIVHHANQALKAHMLFHRDKDYIVRNSEIMLIDEFTGRMMEGRRLSEGLHQAIEAKEDVEIKPENQTLASITFQNYFRLYGKMAGMTGTALTEAAEFQDIYSLVTYELPTNQPVRRTDEDDVIYRVASAKYRDIVEEVGEACSKGQPVLLGTTSIEKSETVSAHLTKAKIAHKVLNARHHAQEAEIIADAGVPGAVTVATNMAGRGTDIQLGGNVDARLEKAVADYNQKHGRAPSQEEQAKIEKTIRDGVEAGRKKALAAGGLYVLGTERHESRRIDNQLRGRTGRQGDPGKSKFFISVEDDLMRVFAAERLNAIMKSLGIKDDEGITHPWMNKAIQTSQKKIEQRNFEIRKNVLKYDDVINDQRKVIFEQRKDFMQAESILDEIVGMRDQVIDELVARHMPQKSAAELWDIEGLHTQCQQILNLDLPIADWSGEDGVANAEMIKRIRAAAEKAYDEKVASTSTEQFRLVEKQVVLRVLDTLWRQHLQQIDQLRSVIHLRSYGQRDPLNEFKEEAFKLFYDMLSEMRIGVTTRLMAAQFTVLPPQPPTPPQPPVLPQSLAGQKAADAGAVGTQTLPTQPGIDEIKSWGRVPRNAPCPCGSGRKYKHCHGALARQTQKL